MKLLRYDTNADCEFYDFKFTRIIITEWSKDRWFNGEMINEFWHNGNVHFRQMFNAGLSALQDYAETTNK